MQGPEAIECGLLVSRVWRTHPARCPVGSSQPAAGQSGASAAGGGPGYASGRVRVELAAAHTSQTFGVAYQAAGMQRPEAIILRQKQQRQQLRQQVEGDDEAVVEVEWHEGHAACQHAEAQIACFEFCCGWDMPEPLEPL